MWKGIRHQQGTQLNGESFYADVPTTEKALRCTVAKWARGTNSSSLAAERSTRRADKTDTSHLAAEFTKVRRGAAKDTPGDHRSYTILYPLRDRQPM